MVVWLLVTIILHASVFVPAYEKYAPQYAVVEEPIVENRESKLEVVEEQEESEPAAPVEAPKTPAPD